jgi:uncharacterized protein YqgQ
MDMVTSLFDTNGDDGAGIDQLLNDVGILFGDKDYIAISRTELTALYRRQLGRRNSHLGARKAEAFQERSEARGWTVVPPLRQVKTHGIFLVLRSKG